MEASTVRCRRCQHCTDFAHDALRFAKNHKEARLSHLLDINNQQKRPFQEGFTGHSCATRPESTSHLPWSKIHLLSAGAKM